MEIERIPNSRSKASLGVAVGRLLFISGQVPRDAEGNVVAPGNLEAQTRNVFEKIASITESAGGDMSNVVKITFYLITFDDYNDFSRIRAEYFGNERPASSTVQVTRLLDPEFMVEIEAVAILPG